MIQKLSIKHPLLFQILAGIIFALLELLANILQQYNPIPLYMDTLFTVTASFFSALSGLICVSLYHTICALFRSHEAISLIWSICSFSLVLIIRLYIRNKSQIHIFDIILLVLIIAITVSLEGAMIFTIINTLADYREDSQVRPMYQLLSKNSLPRFISAFLPRIPVNILDKGICTSLGYLVFIGFKNLISSKEE
ncbi:MAG: hypothetical protein K5873_00815 [Treponema sp.]|nr:hypothetical protein [Treponema sp.]